MPIKTSTSGRTTTFEFIRSWKISDIVGVIIPFAIGAIVGIWSWNDGWFLLGGPILVLGGAYSAQLIQGVVANNRKSSVFVAYEEDLNLLSATWPGGPRELNQVPLDKVGQVHLVGEVQRKYARTGQSPLLVFGSPLTNLRIPISVLASPDIRKLTAPALEQHGSPEAKMAANSVISRNLTW